MTIDGREMRRRYCPKIDRELRTRVPRSRRSSAYVGDFLRESQSASHSDAATQMLTTVYGREHGTQQLLDLSAHLPTRGREPQQSRKLSVTAMALTVGMFMATATAGFAQEAGPTDAASASSESLVDLARRDAAVASALDLPRKTAAEQFRVVAILLDLDHQDAAGQLAPELFKAKLTAQEHAALVREFGTARFTRLLSLEGSKTAGGRFVGATAFAQACLDAAAAEARDPQRLAKLIGRLASKSEEERYAARADLQACGEPGVTACIAALAKEKKEDVRGQIMATLVEMRPASDSAVVAALADGRGTLRRDAAEMAGRMMLREALPYLAWLAAGSDDGAATSAAAAGLQKLRIPQPSQAEAIALIRARMLELAHGAPVPTAPGDDGRGVWAAWDDAAGALSLAQFTPLQLRTLASARLARALVDAGGVADRPADRRAALIYGWEEIALLQRKPSKALTDMIAASTVDDLSVTLGSALATEHPAAAEAAARELGRRGDASILASSDGLPSPLAEATGSADREVQFAALEAVMALKPPRTFPGASRVVEGLWSLAAAWGEPTAVAVSPVFTRASDWAGRLRGIGYDATAVGTPREALAEAAAAETASRLAVVLLDGELGGPMLRELIYQFRASERTALTPIVIGTSAEGLDEAKLIAEGAERVLAVPRPQKDETFAATIHAALPMSQRRDGEAPVEPSEIETRQKRAATALGWIAKLLSSGEGFDELIRQSPIASRALHRAALGKEAIAVLSELGTAASQTSLVEFASSSSNPLELRQAAAAAFVHSAQRFGVQLTRTQMFDQYGRYNASETEDGATQKLLGAMLDAIEGKSGVGKAEGGR